MRSSGNGKHGPRPSVLCVIIVWLNYPTHKITPANYLYLNCARSLLSQFVSRCSHLKEAAESQKVTVLAYTQIQERDERTIEREMDKSREFYGRCEIRYRLKLYICTFDLTIPSCAWSSHVIVVAKVHSGIRTREIWSAVHVDKCQTWSNLKHAVILSLRVRTSCDVATHTTPTIITWEDKFVRERTRQKCRKTPKWLLRKKREARLDLWRNCSPKVKKGFRAWEYKRWRWHGRPRRDEIARL